MSTKAKFKPLERIVVLLTLLVIQITLLSLSWNNDPHAHVSHGFLIHSQNQFIVFWRDKLGRTQKHIFHQREQAMNYYQDELGLRLVRNGAHTLETVWLEERDLSAYRIFWKQENSDFLHQLTFAHKEDALFFVQAFRQGFYAHSPYGHSLRLSH